MKHFIDLNVGDEVNVYPLKKFADFKTIQIDKPMNGKIISKEYDVTAYGCNNVIFEIKTDIGRTHTCLLNDKFNKDCCVLYVLDGMFVASGVGFISKHHYNALTAYQHNIYLKTNKATF